MTITEQISQLEDEAYVAFHQWKDNGDLNAKAKYESLMKQIEQLELSSINSNIQLEAN